MNGNGMNYENLENGYRNACGNSGSCPCGNSRNQGALFEEIRALSFVMDELRLYLDTHPKSSEALRFFLETEEKRKGLLADYTAQYGPIDSYDINDDGTWSWLNEPMPWKAEAN